MKPKISKLTECPPEMPVTPEMKAYAQKIGYVADLYSLTEDFLIHHGAEGTLFKNWNLAWKKWLRNQKEWYPNKNVSSNRQPGEIESYISQEEWQKKYGDPKKNREKIAAIVPNLTKKI